MKGMNQYTSIMKIALNRIGRLADSIHLWLLLVPLSLLLLPTNAAATEPISPGGEAIANACATCHGPDGRSQGAIPSINTLSKKSFVTAMRAFQTGERQGTVMNRIAKGLDETEIEAVAAYFESLRKN